MVRGVVTPNVNLYSKPTLVSKFGIGYGLLVTSLSSFTDDTLNTLLYYHVKDNYELTPNFTTLLPLVVRTKRPSRGERT